jgi:hypothetical protein
MLNYSMAILITKFVNFKGFKVCPTKKFNFLTTCLISLFIQLLFIGRYINNDVVNSWVPTAMDAFDYIDRAKLWRIQGFASAFSDMNRMPGYPSVHMLAQIIYPSEPQVFVRIIQVIALALSAGLVTLIFMKFLDSRWSLFGGVLFSAIPLWYFSPILIAENLTSVFFVLILYCTIQLCETHKFKVLLLLGILIACEVYLKPNNILLVAPVVSYILFSNLRRRISKVILLMVMVSLLILPWMVFGKSQQPGLTGLTNGSGINFYIGTGMVLDYNGGVLEKAAVRWKVDPRANLEDQIPDITNFTSAEKNRIYTQKSIEIWKSRPLSQMGFGFEKILIAFGLKGNTLADYPIGVFSSLAILTSMLNVYRRSHLAWSYSTLATGLVLGFQVALFQADRRFIIPSFFVIACFPIVAFLQDAMKYSIRKRSESRR